MLELLSPDEKNEKITICVGEMVNLLVIVILLVCCFQNLNIPEVDNFSALCVLFVSGFGFSIGLSKMVL